MPPFRRFVAITSAILFLVYLFYPSHIPVSQIVDQAVASTTEAAKRGSQQVVLNIEDDTGLQSLSEESTSAVQPSDPNTVLSLREQLAREFPYRVDSVFPSFIWQTWKYTPSDSKFDEKFRTPEATWTEAHPGHIHEVITDKVAALLVKHLYAKIPLVLDAYNALPKPILKADFFRYLILYARGGVYSDIDTEAIKPVWEWVPETIPYGAYGLVIGIEADPDRDDWAAWYSRRIQFCQWTIRSKPGHPGLQEAIVRITEETLKLKASNKLFAETESIVEWTGPAMWTDAIYAYMNRALDDSSDGREHHNISWNDFTGIKAAKRVGDVVVLPITGFSPGQGHMGSEDFDHPTACVKHDFEGTWKPEDERMKEEKEEAKG